MRRVRSFFGGIHPHDAKKRTTGTPIRELPAPDTLVVPLRQHAGLEAKPVVAKGDEVLKGQLLAEAGGAISAPVHSPVSGKVRAIEPRAHESGRSVTAIVIENDHNDTWVETKGHPDPVQLDVKAILKGIKEAGIVGMGGAGFPTAVKLSPPKGTTIDYLLINGCECEPYLTSDDRLMVEHAEEIILGARLMAKVLGARSILVAVEDNKPEALASLRAKAGNIEVVSVPTKYPQGGEKQLIQALTGREVRSNGLPYQVGTVVQNVGTAWAVALALRDGKPLIARVVTVTGAAIGEPQNFMAPLGTTMEYLIEAAGGFAVTPEKVVVGGPMTGGAQFDLQAPVTKTTVGVVAFGEGESRTPDSSPCIKCARCVDVCPANLLPLKLEAFGMNERWDDAHDYGALDCIECGACTYICPAKRPLLQYIRFAKMEIIARDKKPS
ncbi:MAG: electron transport complex subunit RsxC [Bacillota bacterium]|jgi:electron transport complex protein RnfC|nr:electron transport complex subunit RsxC [Bacillota bacterium]HHT90470.1 electron transport complex subunit RsxC [Bacillota bacterium]